MKRSTFLVLMMVAVPIAPACKNNPDKAGAGSGSTVAVQAGSGSSTAPVTPPPAPPPASNDKLEGQLDIIA